MTDDQFRALMRLMMVSDPTPISPSEDLDIQALLQKEAASRGFDSWYVAFHEF